MRPILKMCSESLTFEHPVPWDQVLDLVLKMNHLGMVHEGDIVRIATLVTLQKEQQLRQAKLEAEKKAREQQVAVEPLITEYIPINYSNAKVDIQPHLEKIKTADRGSISVDDRTNIIIMTDVAATIVQAKEIVHFPGKSERPGISLQTRILTRWVETLDLIPIMESIRESISRATFRPLPSAPWALILPESPEASWCSMRPSRHWRPAAKANWFHPLKL